MAVIAVAFIVEIECLEPDSLAIADIQHRARRPGAELAVGGFKLAAGFHGRTGTANIDHTADGVAAKQRSLRAAQHFDLFDIEEIEQLAGVGADEHTIDDNSDSWLLRFLDVSIGQAPNRKVGSLPARVLLRDQKVRRGTLKVADGSRGLVFQHRGVDCGDRNRRILKRFIAAPGRNDDFIGIGHFSFGRHILCKGRTGSPGKRRGGNGGQQHAAESRLAHRYSLPSDCRFAVP